MINYSSTNSPNASEVAELFTRSGIRRPVDDLPRIERMLANASIVITACDGDRLVGIARSLTDFSYCCYLSDLAVDRDYQKQGIGRELVRLTRDAIGEECMLLLLSAPEAMEYYPKLGMDAVTNAWMFKRSH